MTAVAERIPIVHRARRQPRLRLDRRALALGRLGRVRHPLPLRRRRAALPLDPPASDVLPLDLAANAESLGARVIRAGDVDELREALSQRAGAPTGRWSIHIEADRYAGVPSYESWWDVPVAEVSDERRRAQRPARLTNGAARPATAT